MRVRAGIVSGGRSFRVLFQTKCRRSLHTLINLHALSSVEKLLLKFVGLGRVELLRGRLLRQTESRRAEERKCRGPIEI